MELDSKIGTSVLVSIEVTLTLEPADIFPAISVVAADILAHRELCQRMFPVYEFTVRMDSHPTRLQPLCA